MPFPQTPWENKHFWNHEKQKGQATRQIPSTMSKIPRKTSIFGSTVNKYLGKLGTCHPPCQIPKEASIFGSTASNVAKKDSPNSIHYVKNPWENKHFWDHDEQSGQARLAKFHSQWSKIPRKTSTFGSTVNKYLGKRGTFHPDCQECLGKQALLRKENLPHSAHTSNSLGKQVFLESRETEWPSDSPSSIHHVKNPWENKHFWEHCEQIPRNNRHISSTMSKIPKETSILGSIASNVAKKDSPNSIHYVKNPWENKHFWDHDEQSGQARLAKFHSQWSKIPRKTSIFGSTVNKYLGKQGTFHPDCQECLGKQALLRKENSRYSAHRSKILGKTSIFGITRNRMAKRDSPNSIHNVKNPWENKHFWEHHEQIPGKTRHISSTMSKSLRKQAFLGAP